MRKYLLEVCWSSLQQSSANWNKMCPRLEFYSLYMNVYWDFSACHSPGSKKKQQRQCCLLFFFHTQDGSVALYVTHHHTVKPVLRIASQEIHRSFLDGRNLQRINRSVHIIITLSRWFLKNFMWVTVIYSSHLNEQSINKWWLNSCCRCGVRVTVTLSVQF